MDSAVVMNTVISTMPAAVTPVSETMPDPIGTCPPLDVTSGANSRLVTRWLKRLLQHFGLHELGSISDRSLATLLARCGEDRVVLLQDSYLLSELRRRIVRLTGAQLDDAFIAMAPDIVSEDDIELTTLSVESRCLKGMRYQSEVYRLVDAFEPCHRLQAFCLGQTLAESALGKTISDEASLAISTSAYLITRSTERFAVWVNVRLLPEFRYPHHLPSKASILEVAS